MKPRPAELGPCSEYEMQVLFRPDIARTAVPAGGALSVRPRRAVQLGGDSAFGHLDDRLAQHLRHSDARPIAASASPAGRASRTRPDRPGRFIVGLERCLQLFDNDTGSLHAADPEVDAYVSGTVINDGVAFDDGIVFGCKDLKFAEAQGGTLSLSLRRQATDPASRRSNLLQRQDHRRTGRSPHAVRHRHADQDGRPLPLDVSAGKLSHNGARHRPAPVATTFPTA